MYIKTECIKNYFFPIPFDEPHSDNSLKMFNKPVIKATCITFLG